MGDFCSDPKSLSGSVGKNSNQLTEAKGIFSTSRVSSLKLQWGPRESNPGHHDLQSCALPLS